MANDRMYIRCKGCGDLHFLAKCYDDGYFTTHEGEELRQGLDDFFDRHKWCYCDKYYGGFELVYESDDWLEKQKEPENSSASTMAPSCWAEEPSLQKEPKPVEWSEEDENVYESIQTILLAEARFVEERKWFDSIKARIRSVCWSEEDEDNLHRVIRVLEDNDSDWKELSDWLKALRPDSYKNCNSRWKPSEEQMAALEAATVRYQSTGLESLFEDLKKL